MEKNEWGLVICVGVFSIPVIAYWWSERHIRRIDKLECDIQAARLQLELDHIKRQSLRAQGRHEEIN